MFEAVLKLGKVDESSWEASATRHVAQVRKLLRGEGLQPKAYLLRGGFRTKRDLELVLNTGSDYTGRPWPSENGYAPRLSEDSIFATPLLGVGSEVRNLDPLWHAAFKGEAHALAVYDASKLEHAQTTMAKTHDLTEYTFINPASKQDALLGIVMVELSLAQNQLPVPKRQRVSIANYDLKPV